MRIALLVTAALAVSLPAFAQSQTPAPPAETREANLTAYTELLRSDLRTQKVALITEMMQFSEEEDAKFWPIYREYEGELAKINDDRIRLIDDYTRAYQTMTDAIADKLGTRALDLEGQRHALKQKYFARFKSALPPITVLRFFQVENQILMLLDLQIAAALPIVR